MWIQKKLASGKKVWSRRIGAWCGSIVKVARGNTYQAFIKHSCIHMEYIEQLNKSLVLLSLIVYLYF